MTCDELVAYIIELFCLTNLSDPSDLGRAAVYVPIFGRRISLTSYQHPQFLVMASSKIARGRAEFALMD